MEAKGPEVQPKLSDMDMSVIQFLSVWINQQTKKEL